MNGVMLGPHDASASVFRSALAEHLLCARSSKPGEHLEAVVRALPRLLWRELHARAAAVALDVWHLRAERRERQPPWIAAQINRLNRLSNGCGADVQVNRLALWNLGDNLGGKAGWPPQLMAELAAFVRGGR